MKVYLAGPMTGIKYLNYPTFRDGAARLRAAGHVVFSPAEHIISKFGVDYMTLEGDEKAIEGFDRREALCDDLVWICRHADAVVLLLGWERSTGATAERATAVALGLGVLTIEEVT